MDGNTQSCGCYAKQRAKETCLQYIAGKNKLDITNQKFGSLTALKPANKKTSNGKTEIWICQCQCGTIVEVPVSHLKSGHTQSCGCIRSRGERKIKQLLNEHSIPFKCEWTGFINNKCIADSGNYYRFDFYLPDYNCCIEYDGVQHFIENGWTGSSLEERQKRDKFKDEYCKNNNLRIIRIPYTDYEILDWNYLKSKIFF